MALSFEEKLEKKRVKDYKNKNNKFIVISCFNNKTWAENEDYRSNHKEVACIYCSPEPPSKLIPLNSVMFVFEMNNDTNKIMGIGFIKNKPSTKQYFVYENDNYNRYSYLGGYRIDRSDMSEEEERIMQVFDELCFRGNTHMKRCQGLKSFPFDMLYRMSAKLDLVNFITQMFKQRITAKNDQTTPK